MKEFFSQNSIALTIAALVVVILPGGYFGVSTLLGQIRTNIEVLQTKKIDQRVQQNFLLSADALERQKTLIEESSDEIDVILGETDDETIALYADIERLAAESQNSSISLRVEGFGGTKSKQAPASPTAGRNVQDDEGDEEETKVIHAGATGIDGPAVARAPFNVAPASDKFLYLNISTIGTYNNLLAFIHKIENMKYFSDILEIRIVAGESSVSTDDSETQDTRSNLVSSNVYVAFYLSGGSARDERLVDPAAGLNSAEMLGR